MEQRYFNWLCSQVATARYRLRYSKLLTKLYFADYEWTIPNDANRADDGMGLRYLFAQENDYSEAEMECTMAQKQCCVLEMMVALVIRCESDYLGNPDVVDHKMSVFMEMLKSMDIHTMENDVYNDGIVENALVKFMSHQYSPDGKGSIFYVPQAAIDMRKEELWSQMNQWVLYIFKL